MRNELNICETICHIFKYLKDGETETGVPKYQLQIFSNDDVNLTSLYQDIVGVYDKVKDMLVVTTFSIESTLCYIIESIY